MSQEPIAQPSGSGYFSNMAVERISTVLTGLIAVLIALKAAYWSPDESLLPLQNQIVRMTAFASLTVWTTFAVGLQRRGVAAMLSMVFAAVLELLIMPARNEEVFTLGSASSGIVLAFLALQFYFTRSGQRRTSA